MEDFRKSRQFQAISGALQGKWFATEREHAAEWGRWFGSKTGMTHDRIIAVEMPIELYNQFEPIYDKLDGIGPACFAPIEVLRDVVFEEVQK